MALKVEIEGIGEIIAEGFAEQETLEQIRVLLEKMEKLGATQERRERTDRANQKNTNAKSKNNSAFDPAAANSIDELISSVDVLSTKNSILAGSVTAASAVFDDSAKILQGAATGTDDVMGSLQTVITTVTDRMSALIGAAGEAATAIPFLGKVAKGTAMLAQGALAAGAAASGMVLAQVHNLIEQSDQLTDMSVFVGKMGEFAEHATNSGLTIEQYTNVVKSNTDKLMQLGGTIEGGARRLAAVNKLFGEKAHEDIQNTMRALGHGPEAQAQLAASVMMQQTMLFDKSRSVFKHMDETEEDYEKRMLAIGMDTAQAERQQLETIRDYTVNLHKLSKLTGKSVEELDAERIKERQRAAMQSKYRQMEADGVATAGMQSAMQFFGEFGEEVEFAAMQLAHGQVGPEAAKLRQKVPEFFDFIADTMDEANRGTPYDMEKLIARMQELGASAAGDTMLKNLESFSQFGIYNIGNEYINEVQDIHGTMLKFLNRAKNISDEEMANLEKTGTVDPKDLSSSIANARNEMQRYATAIQRLGIEGAPLVGDLVDFLSDSVKDLEKVALTAGRILEILLNESLSTMEKERLIRREINSRDSQQISGRAGDLTQNRGVSDQHAYDIAEAEAAHSPVWEIVRTAISSIHAAGSTKSVPVSLAGSTGNSGYYHAMRSMLDDDYFADTLAARVNTYLGNNDSRRISNMFGLFSRDHDTHISNDELAAMLQDVEQTTDKSEQARKLKELERQLADQHTRLQEYATSSDSMRAEAARIALQDPRFDYLKEISDRLGALLGVNRQVARELQ